MLFLVMEIKKQHLGFQDGWFWEECRVVINYYSPFDVMHFHYVVNFKGKDVRLETIFRGHTKREEEMHYIFHEPLKWQFKIGHVWILWKLRGRPLGFVVLEEGTYNCGSSKGGKRFWREVWMWDGNFCWWSIWNHVFILCSTS